MEETVYYERVGLYTNVSCNLKCKLCNAYSPYYAEKTYYSYECLSKLITKYFDVVDKVDKFTIAGGEPLLHPKLAEVVEYLKNYQEKIREI
jgi:molybdenum cofactor biosynthesis enzyme MoaA